MCRTDLIKQRALLLSARANAHLSSKTDAPTLATTNLNYSSTSRILCGLLTGREGAITTVNVTAKLQP